jgi:hypothetical protein
MNMLNKITSLKRRCALAAIGMLSVIVIIAVQAGVAEPAAASLEARLQKVEDILAIQQLLGDYMTDMDAIDYDAYSELFAADGELIFQAYRLKGPKAIRDLMGQGSRGVSKSGASTSGLRHMISNIVIRVDGARATSTARWIVMSQGTDSRPILGATGHYEDTLRKDGARWKFQRRVIYADFPYQNPLEAK